MDLSPFKLRWAYFDIFILTIHPPFKLKWKTKMKYVDIFWHILTLSEYFWMPHCLTYQPNWTLPGALPGHSLMVMVPLRSLSICRKASRTCYLPGVQVILKGKLRRKCVAVMLYIYTWHIQYMHNISHAYIYILILLLLLFIIIVIIIIVIIIIIIKLYICVCMCVYSYIYTYMCVCLYIHIYIYACVCVCEVGTRHPKPKVHDSTQLYL